MTLTRLQAEHVVTIYRETTNKDEFVGKILSTTMLTKDVDEAQSLWRLTNAAWAAGEGK